MPSAQPLVLGKIRQDTDCISSRASFMIVQDHMWLSVFRVEITDAGPFERITGRASRFTKVVASFTEANRKLTTKYQKSKLFKNC